MNGEPIAVRPTPLGQAMVVSGGLRSMQEHGLERFYAELAAAAWRVRGLGDFWGHMLVARGAAQVMVDPTVRTWDTAAVEVIVRCGRRDDHPARRLAPCRRALLPDDVRRAAARPRPRGRPTGG